VELFLFSQRVQRFSYSLADESCSDCIHMLDHCAIEVLASQLAMPTLTRRRDEMRLGAGCGRVDHSAQGGRNTSR